MAWQFSNNLLSNDNWECIQTWKIENWVCVCAKKKEVYIYQVSSPGSTVDTWKPTNSQDLRQEVVGHIEATLNASAIEVGWIEICLDHEVDQESRRKNGLLLGGRSCSTIGKAPMNLTNDWMDVDVD